MWLHKLPLNRIKDTLLLFREGKKNLYMSNKSVKFLSEPYGGSMVSLKKIPIFLLIWFTIPDPVPKRHERRCNAYIQQISSVKSKL